MWSRARLIAGSVTMCFQATALIFAGEPTPGLTDREKALPPGAIARLGSLRLRHEHEVRSIAFSPDGKKIASVSCDAQTIRVWAVATGKLLHEFDAPGIFSRDFFSPADYTIAFTRDCNSVAAGVGADVCFWDLQSGREVRRFRGKGKGISALTFSRDGKTFYCGGSDNKLYQWDIATGKICRSWDYFAGNQPRTYASGFASKTAGLEAISPDGKTAVWRVVRWADTGNGVGGDGSEVAVWDVGTGKDRCRFTGKDDKVFSGGCVVLSPDGRLLTAHDRNSKMIVWDAPNGKKLKALGNGYAVEAVAYSPDCRRVAAFTRANVDGLSVWDLATGNEIWRRQIAPWYAPGWDKSLTFSPDGKSVALAFGNNVLICDAESGEDIPFLEGHRWRVGALAFSPKDGALISACCASVCEWNSASRQTSRHFLIAYHGHTRSAAESYEAKLRIFQPERGPPQLRDLLSDKLIHEFAEVKGTYYHGCFSADGHTAALARRDKEGEIVFLDVSSRKTRSRLTIEKPINENLVLTSDGKRLAVSCADQTVVLIDSFRGKLVRQLGAPQPLPKGDEPRTSLTEGVFSPDGELLAFGTHVDRPGDHWKWKFGKLDSIAPDPPGIRVWQVATGRELRQFENCLANAPHGGITSLRFSPDNKSLAVALHFNPWHPGDPDEAAVPILEVSSGQLRRRFRGHTGHVACLAFSSDGKRLATGSEDSTILLWDMKRPVGADPAAGKPVAERISLHWMDLGQGDAAAAYDAVLALAQLPGETVAFLAERLKPVESRSDKQLAKWVADLDDDAFVVRHEAFVELAALDEVARQTLEKALNGMESPEARRRIEKLLYQLEPINYPATLRRELRAVEVLEQIASKEACRLVKVLAGGAAESVLTIEAKASLYRLRLP